MKAGIAGAGIMGRLLARALRRAGWDITLYDQHDGCANCSSVAAGLLSPISELDKATMLIYRMGMESITTHWPEIVRECPDPIFFKKMGSLVVHHPQDQIEWDHFSRRVTQQLGPDHTSFEMLSNEQLIQLEPTLGKFERAYFLPDEAQIDSQSLMTHLNQNIVINTRVISIHPGEIHTENQTHHFDHVFDCRGLGARDSFDDLRGVRGELIWLDAPDVHITRPIRLLHPRYSLYIVPRPGNIYIVGASESETDDDSPISVRTTLELLTACYYVHSGFAEASIIKTVTHHRPTLSDHLPRIRTTDGLTAINGLYRHGYLIAPTIAEEIVRDQRRYPEIWEDYDDHHAK